jgi:LPS-assembly protein
MRYLRFMVSSIFFLVIVWSPSFLRVNAAEMKITKGEGPVDIEADQLIYDKEAQLYEAHGNVSITHGTLSLKADHVQLYMATKDLVAWGNVLLVEGEDVVECDRLEVNLDTRLGKIYQAKLFLKDQNFHITGREAEKLGEARYRIKDGSFTTCDAKRPPWKFTVKELDVTLEGYGIAKGPVFYVENIPLIYLPVGIFPLKKERQTGLLFPIVGYSNKNGPEVKNAFFWAISKDMDSTLYLDYLGKRGFKEGLEYRYAITPDLNGQANFYFIDDRVFGENRYAFFVQHQQYSTSGLYLKGDINHVSDHQYLRDFDEDLPKGAMIDSWSYGYLRSVLFGGKNWDQFSFLSEGIVFDDLARESNDETLQRLPQVSFYAHPQSLFHTPFFYDLSSSYTHFWREQGVQAHRGDLFPRISYPLRVFNVLKLESDLGLRETVYRSQDDPDRQLQGWESRETFETGVGVSTEFFRVYDAASASKIPDVFHVAKWMHTLEPTISYRYSPRVRQSDLPLLDEVDRIPYTHQITYGITQRLVGKPEKEGIRSGPYEYGKLMIFQNYSLGDPFQIDTKGKERYFSDIQAELWWNFSPYLSTQGDAEFNPYDGHFDQLNALITARNHREDAVQVQYRNTRGSIKEINFNTRVKTISSLYLYGGIRYNLLEKTGVEDILGAEYQSQCWTMGLLVDYIHRSPDGTQKKDIKFEVYINLLGIGSFGRKPFVI